MGAARSVPPLARKVGIFALVVLNWGEEASPMALPGAGLANAVPFSPQAGEAVISGRAITDLSAHGSEVSETLTAPI
jgi:hypothetical protein